MNIEIINKTKGKIAIKELQNLAEIFAKKHHLPFSSLAIVLVGETRIRTLNREYRQKDQATDILSFSPANFPGAGAELILCSERIFRCQNYREVLPDLMAKPKNKLKKYLLFFVLTHGLLHLAGYDDEKEQDRLLMVDLGRKFLVKNGFSLA